MIESCVVKLLHICLKGQSDEGGGVSVYIAGWLCLLGSSADPLVQQEQLSTVTRWGSGMGGRE